MVAVGVIITIGSCVAGFNPVGLGIGISLIIGGVVLLAMGSPQLGFGDKIKGLRGNMKSGIKDFQDAVDLVIAELNNCSI